MFLGTKKCVPVDISLDPGNTPLGSILPERPSTPRIALLRVRIHGSDPQGIVVEITHDDVSIEIDCCINHRSLAIMALDRNKKRFHRRKRLRLGYLFRTKFRVAVPFNIQHGW